MSYVSRVLDPPGHGQVPPPLGLAAGEPSLCGGGARPDGRFNFGYSLLRGKRQNMEDFCHAQFKHDQRAGQAVGLFGIFDGHGGPNAADFVRSNLFLNLLQNTKFPRDMRGALGEAYEITDGQYLKQDANNTRDDGCTAVTAVLIGNQLTVANVGDSRAVLCRGGKAIPVSVDHKPNSKDERERIEAAGGVIVWAGTWRVGGVLAVSRAFGDRPLKRYVIATPDVREETLGNEDEFLVLASDGVWDTVSSQDAVDVIRDLTDPEEAAARLTEEAFHRGSNDNISCVVVRFK